MEEVVKDGARRIHADDLDCRVLLLQITADARDGPTSPHTHDEMRDLAFGVLPDLRSGDLVMDLRVSRIRVLVRMIGVGNLMRQLFYHLVIAAWIVYGHGGGTHD